jgi:hypothetical protein
MLCELYTRALLAPILPAHTALQSLRELFAEYASKIRAVVALAETDDGTRAADLAEWVFSQYRASRLYAAWCANIDERLAQQLEREYRAQFAAHPLAARALAVPQTATPPAHAAAANSERYSRLWFAVDNSLLDELV